MIHAANPETSNRLGRALTLLKNKRGVGATTYELHAETNDMAPHTTIAELRASGYNIRTQYDGMTSRGRRIYRYILSRPFKKKVSPALFTFA